MIRECSMRCGNENFCSEVRRMALGRIGVFAPISLWRVRNKYPNRTNICERYIMELARQTGISDRVEFAHMVYMSSKSIILATKI
jgi:hypothetical protein